MCTFSAYPSLSCSKDSKKTAAEKIQEISEPLVLERFVAMADYEKQKKNECSLQAGQQVEVIDKNENGKIQLLVHWNILNYSL